MKIALQMEMDYQKKIEEYRDAPKINEKSKKLIEKKQQMMQ
jgi:hypothetical protein